MSALDQLNRIGGCVRTLLSKHQGTIVQAMPNEQEDTPASVFMKYIYLCADAHEFSKCQNSTQCKSNSTLFCNSYAIGSIV
jgi:hypothetical protein